MDRSKSKLGMKFLLNRIVASAWFGCGALYDGEIDGVRPNALALAVVMAIRLSARVPLMSVTLSTWGAPKNANAAFSVSKLASSAILWRTSE